MEKEIKKLIENMEKEFLDIEIENKHKILMIMDRTINDIEKIINKEEKTNDDKNNFIIHRRVYFR